MKVVVLVPWRPVERIREWNWRIVRPYLEHLGWPIYTGDRPGTWSRSAACNAASKAAGSWEVAVVTDADTVPEVAPVREAVGIAIETAGGVRPHDNLWRLTKQGSMALARKGPGAIRRNLTSGTHLGGGLLVISREAWEAVDGFDERFQGWGHEDSFMGLSLVTRASWSRVAGNAWHLWHPLPVKTTPEYRTNRALLEEKQHSRYTVAAVQRASKRLGFDVGKVL